MRVSVFFFVIVVGAVVVSAAVCINCSLSGRGPWAGFGLRPLILRPCPRGWLELEGRLAKDGVFPPGRLQLAPGRDIYCGWNYNIRRGSVLLLAGGGGGCWRWLVTSAGGCGFTPAVPLASFRSRRHLIRQPLTFYL